jgi:hypothetical protein
MTTTSQRSSRRRSPEAPAQARQSSQRRGQKAQAAFAPC